MLFLQYWVSFSDFYIGQDPLLVSLQLTAHSWSEQLRHDPKPYFTVPVCFSITQKNLPEVQDFYFAFALLQYI